MVSRSPKAKPRSYGVLKTAFFISTLLALSSGNADVTTEVPEVSSLREVTATPEELTGDVQQTNRSLEQIRGPVGNLSEGTKPATGEAEPGPGSAQNTNSTGDKQQPPNPAEKIRVTASSTPKLVTTTGKPKGNETSCLKPSTCKPSDLVECPPPTPLEDGTPCDDEAKRCFGGNCLTYCAFLGVTQSPPQTLWSCDCGIEEETRCRHCCIDMTTRDKQCKAMGEHWADGTKCVSGVCLQGRCMGKKPADMFMGAMKKEEKKDATKKKTRTVSACGSVSPTLVVLVLAVLTASMTEVVR